MTENGRKRTHSAPVDEDDVLPPIKPPAFVRAKSVEEQKSESVGVAQLVPAFRRQRSFEHSLRPVPILDESNPKEYYGGILRGMGFNESEIQEALKVPGENSLEDYVAIIINGREKKETVTPGGDPPDSPEPDEKQKLTSPEPTSSAISSFVAESGKKEEPLTLTFDDDKSDAYWKCRNCNGYVNSSTTEVCIQCNRSRVLCEEFTEVQLQEQKEIENKKN